MAVSANIEEANAELGEVIEYSVSEDATPLIVGDSAGGVGQLSITTRAHKGPGFRRTGSAVGKQVQLVDDTSIEFTNMRGRGTISGNVTSVDLPGERANLRADTMLSRLNTDRTAKPFFGSYVPASTRTTTRTNYATNASREANLDNVGADLGNGGSTATLTRPTTGGVDGLAFARVTFTNNGTAPGAGIKDTVPDLQPGVTYTVSNHYRATRVTPPALNTPAQRIRMVVRFYNSNNVAVGPDTVIQARLLQNEWTRVYVAAEAPATATRLEIYCVSFAGDGYAVWKNGDTFDSDMLMVEQGPLLAPFTGTSPARTETDPFTGVTTDYTYGWAGTPNASRSVEYTAITTPAHGYNATQGAYFRYLCELVDLPVGSVDADFDNRPVAYPGFTGNVWKYMKDFCAAVGAEAAMVNDTIVLRKPRAIELPVESISNPTISVNSSQTSQYVEVQNQNSKWGTNLSAFKATNVYQIETSGYSTSEVTVDHFLTSVNNPVAVDVFNSDYDAGVGQYAIVDSQGLTVPAQWWTVNGGRIVTSLIPDEPNKFRIEIFGPRTNGTVYVGPFKISRPAATEQAPALEITGSGVFVSPELVRLRTGVSAQRTSTEVSSTVENIYLSDAHVTYSRALDLACRAAGPIVTLKGSISYMSLQGQTFGYIAGGRIRYADNIFRVTSASIGRNGISFVAEADMTFADVVDLYAFTFAEADALFAGQTFAQVDAANAGLTFAEFSAQFPVPTFAYVGEIYEGATFLDHAISPNLNEAPL